MVSTMYKSVSKVFKDMCDGHTDVGVVISDLFHRNQIPQAIVSKDGIILEANSKYAELVGYSRPELENRKKFQDITHPEDLKADEASAEKLLNGEISEYSMFKRYLVKNGNIIWIKLMVIPIFDSTGNFFAFFSSALPLAAVERVTIEQKQDGGIKIRPHFTLKDFARDNWKDFIKIFIAIIVGGYATFRYIEKTVEKIDKHEQTIKFLLDERNK